LWIPEIILWHELFRIWMQNISSLFPSNCSVCLINLITKQTRTSLTYDDVSSRSMSKWTLNCCKDSRLCCLIDFSREHRKIFLLPNVVGLFFEKQSHLIVQIGGLRLRAISVKVWMRLLKHYSVEMHVGRTRRRFSITVDKNKLSSLESRTPIGKGHLKELVTSLTA
jgi:hypothetical protein